MLEVKSIDIYANDREQPTISITYTVDKESGSKKSIDMFKMWIRKDVSECYEILNYANLLYYEIYINNKNQLREPHIFRAYQMLFGRKLWKNYTLLTTKVNATTTLKVAPHRNFLEFHKDFMRDHVEKETLKYIKQAKVEKDKL